MAANGRGTMRNQSRTPPFLVIGLVVALVILGFNYWRVSSRNSALNDEAEIAYERSNDLQEQVRMKSTKQLIAEKKTEALLERVRELEGLLNNRNEELQRKEMEVSNINRQLAEKGDICQAAAANLETCHADLKSCMDNKSEIAARVQSYQAEIERLKSELASAEAAKSQQSEQQQQTGGTCTASCYEAAKKDVLTIIDSTLGVSSIQALYNAGLDVGTLKEKYHLGFTLDNMQPKAPDANDLAQQVQHGEQRDQLGQVGQVQTQFGQSQGQGQFVQGQGQSGQEQIGQEQGKLGQGQGQLGQGQGQLGQGQGQLGQGQGQLGQGQGQLSQGQGQFGQGQGQYGQGQGQLGQGQGQLGQGQTGQEGQGQSQMALGQSQLVQGQSQSEQGQGQVLGQVPQAQDPNQGMNQSNQLSDTHSLQNQQHQIGLGNQFNQGEGQLPQSQNVIGGQQEQSQLNEFPSQTQAVGENEEEEEDYDDKGQVNTHTKDTPPKHGHVVNPSSVVNSSLGVGKNNSINASSNTLSASEKKLSLVSSSNNSIQQIGSHGNNGVQNKQGQYQIQSPVENTEVKSPVRNSPEKHPVQIEQLHDSQQKNVKTSVEPNKEYEDEDYDAEGEGDRPEDGEETDLKFQPHMMNDVKEEDDSIDKMQQNMMVQEQQPAIPAQ